MAQLIHKKIPGATLVESLVALTILMAVFGIGMVIFVNITKTGSKSLYYQTKSKMLEIATETKQEKVYLDEEFEDDNIKYIKTVTFYNEKEYLLWLNVKAVNKLGTTISQHNELIVNEEISK